MDAAAVLDPPLQIQFTSRNNYVVLKSFKNKLNEIERVLALISFFTALEVKKSMRMIATTLKLLIELKLKILGKANAKNEIFYRRNFPELPNFSRKLFNWFVNLTFLKSSQIFTTLKSSLENKLL